MSNGCISGKKEKENAAQERKRKIEAANAELFGIDDIDVNFGDFK